jgi:hypothetical protein
MVSLILLLLIVLCIVVFMYKFIFYAKIFVSDNCPYQFSVKNSISNDAKVVLYGYNKHLLTTNFGSDSPVLVIPTFSHISYLECLAQSFHDPFRVKKIILGGSLAQLKQMDILIISADANGQMCQVPVPIKTYLERKINTIDSFKDVDDTIISLDIDYNILIDGRTFLQFNILGNSEIVTTFYIEKEKYIKINIIELLTYKLKKCTAKIRKRNL